MKFNMLKISRENKFLVQKSFAVQVVLRFMPFAITLPLKKIIKDRYDLRSIVLEYSSGYLNGRE